MKNTKSIKRGRRHLGWLMVLLLAAASAVPAVAQSRKGPDAEVRTLSLEEALALSLENNFAVRMADADRDIARSLYRQTNAAFLPRLTVEETGIATNDPLSVFGFRLKQETVSAADFNPVHLNDPDVYENFSTRFELSQPIFNGDMLYKRSAMKMQLEAGREQYESTVRYTRFLVKDTYYQLLLADQKLEVLDRSHETTRETDRQAKNYLEEGIIGRDEYLSARVRLLEVESRQLEAQDQKAGVEDRLRFLLGLDQDLPIEPTDSLASPRYSHERFDGLYARNSELEALRYRVDAARQMVRSARFGFVPSVNLFGSYEFNDEVIFGTAGESYLVGATIRWNLFDGFSKAAGVMQGKAELKKAELVHRSRSIEHKLEIDQTRRSLKQAESQLELAETTVEQAGEHYRIRSDRYAEGMVKTSDLLEAETGLSNARLQRLNALYLYHRSLARLEYLLEQEW